MITTLKTSRLILRPLQQTDTGTLFQLSKEQGADAWGGATLKNLEAAGKYVAGLIAMNKTGISYHWAIEHQQTNAIMGFCNVYLPAPHLIGLRLCETSYSLVHTYRQQGYMTEALGACLKFITQTAGFYRVEASVSPMNQPSIKLLKRLGFLEEGLQRKKWVTGNSRKDMLGYALLADELILAP